MASGRMFSCQDSFHRSLITPILSVITSPPQHMTGTVLLEPPFGEEGIVAKYVELIGSRGDSRKVFMIPFLAPGYYRSIYLSIFTILFAPLYTDFVQ